MLTLTEAEYRALTWITPPECQGQIVETSYAAIEGGYAMRVHDRGARETHYYATDYDSLVDGTVFEPWNEEPLIASWREHRAAERVAS